MPLKRLVDNGVLKERSVGAELFFTFLLDPVAEFAAAYEVSTRNGSDAVKWTLLEEEIGKLETWPAGFMSAMEIVTIAYGNLLGWYPSGYFQPEETKMLLLSRTNEQSIPVNENRFIRLLNTCWRKLEH